MKKLILLHLFLAITFISVSQTSPKWSHFDPTVFARAKKENKLVLLHLRANWCHWCHVMEEKTYTNKNVIAYLAKNYISCMEDHDERQDLTSLYSDYGWPATIIFDSNGKEIFKEAGYIAADEFLPTLTKLRKNPKPLASDLPTFETKPNNSAQQTSLNLLKEKYRNSMDFNGGGFVFGQKYIDFDTFEYTFSHYKSDSLSKWLTKSVVNSTGIYDNQWGGVYQYSTNNDWNHVHYEKLLFIQARYIKMYCWYYKIFKDAEALKKAEGIVKYVNRFLTSPVGGYFSAQDADLIKGEKSHEYFALSDAERMKKGIPAIDSNVYTTDNAQYAEALTILWATTNNQKYLTSALDDIDFLITKRKSNNAFMHGAKYNSTVSLKDNICALKALLLIYRTTQKETYKKEARQIAENISTTFYSGKGYFYTYVGSSALKASYNVQENIETCRLLNYCSHFFNEPAYKIKATETFNFLTSKELSEVISTEPGILSASEEIKDEPITAAFMQKKASLSKDDPLKYDYIRECISFPHFYFSSAIYNKENIIEDKKELFESFDENFTVLCTSSYCSSPMFTTKEFLDFLYKRVLDTK